jgi:hypothetical protein
MSAGIVVVTGWLLAAPLVAAQSAASPPPEAMALSPTTKLEAFTQSAGPTVTLGYDDLGAVTGFGGEARVAVDVREMRDAAGGIARGVVVEVTEGKDRKDHSFIDAEEIPDLLRAVDYLLSVKTNPTAFGKFEVTYRTRGELEITALNTSREAILYSVKAGRTVRAQASGITPVDLQKIRAMLDQASQKLAWLATAR